MTIPLCAQYIESTFPKNTARSKRTAFRAFCKASTTALLENPPLHRILEVLQTPPAREDGLVGMPYTQHWCVTYRFLRAVGESLAFSRRWIKSKLDPFFILRVKARAVKARTEYCFTRGLNSVYSRLRYVAN